MWVNIGCRIVVMCALLCLAGCGDNRTSEVSTPGPNDWLLTADSDDERFRLLQQQMRGFDQPMWEVGERYSRMHDALTRGNSELASYHWEKIKTTIENGYAKRPARRENAETLFLEPVWTDVKDDLKSGDAERAWRGFDRAKAACQACHVAEKVGYMNDQAVFDLTASTSAGE